MLTKRIRRAAARRCLVLAGIVVPFVSLAVANPSWAKSVGIDVWNVPGLEEELAAADRDRVRLAGFDVTLMNRIAAKEAIIGELIAGRATLADAASQFLSLNAERPDLLEMIRSAYPNRTDEERAALNVIDYVAQRVADPVAREEIVSRLAADLAEMPRRGDER